MPQVRASVPGTKTMGRSPYERMSCLLGTLFKPSFSLSGITALALRLPICPYHFSRSLRYVAV